MMTSSVFINDVEFERNKVRCIPCKCWEDFTREVTKDSALRVDENNTEIGIGVIYRGHASTEWKLSSKLERAFYTSDGWLDHLGSPIKPNFKQIAKGWYEKASKDILNKFKLLAEGIEGRNLPERDDELWALGRHYGLLTPFLDWTESPYIAAFFAFIELYKSLEFKIVQKPFFLREGKVHIWGLRRWSNLEVKNEFEIVSLPRHFGSRSWAQTGLFTKLTSNEYLDIKSYLENKGLAHYLECYELPYECADTALSDLKLMNISFSKLFPDLFGAAQEANISEECLRVFQLQKSVINKENTT